ncbi:hypothetical protein EDC01DRAFT_618567 [Geopyxis carbonaria]|nr:hypothetical protein EDC01DRAFT_618567 [Geopyxis carbonaria]
MTSRSRTRNSSSRSHQGSPFPPPNQRDEHQSQVADHNSSNNTSASTSRHPSNASIFSLPFTTPHSRHSTPPTPLSSPSLYRPPSLVLPSDGASDAPQYLHPSQYRLAEQVRETHSLDVEYDPVSGRKTINHYSIIEEIGRGTHGKVKLGFDLNTNDMVAIKIVERSQGRPRLGRKGDGDNSETKVRREIAILKKIRHENVVRLLEVIDDARYKKVYLVLEYVVRGEVIWNKDDERKIPAMDIEEARRCFRDTVVGLDHLHWNGIVHRDIKPANLLWSNDKTTKISDFGVSFLGRPIRDEDDEGTGEDEPTGFEQDDLELAKTAGTPAFFAPELCSLDITKPRVPITCAIDVWALGVTLFCFIFGRIPFMADHEYTLFKCISEDELIIPRQPVDDDLRDLIKRLLTKNPSKRILLKEVKRHPWVLEGLHDPIGWVERNDPERASHGNKIQITTEDVETAVSVPGIITRAKSAIRKATGSWVRGLRKRGSSTANSKEVKEAKEARERECATGLDAAGESIHKQGQPNFIRLDDPDRELQWMGRIAESRDDDMLNTLVPSTTNSSTGSSETVHGKPNENVDHFERSDSHFLEFSPKSGRNEHRLRRTQPMSLIGGNVLRRHSSQSNDVSRTIRASHRAPIEPPPGTPMFDPSANVFKSESTAALVAPSIVRRMVRTTRSDDSALLGSRKPSSYDDRCLFGAREVLTEALHSSNKPQEVGTLPCHTPESRSLYTVIDDVENGTMLNLSPRSCNTDVRQRMEQHRREEQELARQRLGKINLDDMLDQPCSLSPNDDTPVQTTAVQGNLKNVLEEKEQQHYTSQHGSPNMKTPTGWTHNSYHIATPPMAMALNPRSMGYFDLHGRPTSPKSNPPGANLVSSSSDERFNTTAGSSLTNSTSFPSVLTNPSSVSSDFFHPYSRKSSLIPAIQSQEASMDEDYRIREMQRNSQSRRGSEFIFQPDQDEDEDSDSDSEGGFVMKSPSSNKSPRLYRTKSIAVGQLARQSNEEKDRALAKGKAKHVKTNSKSSGGSTIKERDDNRGRAIERD